MLPVAPGHAAVLDGSGSIHACRDTLCCIVAVAQCASATAAQCVLVLHFCQYCLLTVLPKAAGCTTHEAEKRGELAPSQQLPCAAAS